MWVIDSVPCSPESNGPAEVEITMETAPAVLFDALVLPSGKAAIDALAKSDQAMEFLKLQYRHCKPILALEGARALLEECRHLAAIARPQCGPRITGGRWPGRCDRAEAFVKAIARHRHFERQIDPPTDLAKPAISLRSPAHQP